MSSIFAVKKLSDIFSERLSFIQVKASAKYGVKAVTMLGVPAAQTPEVWQADIPLASAPKMPLTAVILDKHDNELRVQLL